MYGESGGRARRKDMSESILSHCIETAIRTDPQAAAREVPKIVNFYILDNSLLNSVYLAARRVLIQPDKFGLDMLRRAVEKAEATHGNPTP
jgi:hypothetical protein